MRACTPRARRHDTAAVQKKTVRARRVRAARARAANGHVMQLANIQL
jgi:hypothetical protein